MEMRTEEVEIILKYFDVNDRQKEQLRLMLPLYREWNARINVISRKDIDQLYIRHVLHSLAIARVAPFSPGMRVLDVGTGGGFPGIPLAIMFPEVSFHLTDSIGKKITVVRAIASALELNNITAEHIRSEDVAGSYDFAVSRAVTTLAELWKWTSGKLHRGKGGGPANGMLCLKGGALEGELSALKAKYKIWPIADMFVEDFFAEKYVVHIFSNK
jgi:16S rRNA (guanine527-N7)-methyltransferase